MAARNVELELANREMEAFIYSISHDLRAPLRSMAGFARIMVDDYAGRLDEQGADYLGRILRGSAKMSRLIDDLLDLSRISRQEVQKTEVDLSSIAASVISDMREADPGRRIDVTIEQGLSAFADRRLARIVLSNLLGNAWKFTSTSEDAHIEFGDTEKEGSTIFYVRDNGAGFDAEYMEKMFLPFQRLHSDKEFEGTGIGLTIVERIIHRHGGRVWAEGKKGQGAAIFFTFGQGGSRSAPSIKAQA
jgi:light-regulated signal transduction histidine kinase (bacteriophytochrome)